MFENNSSTNENRCTSPRSHCQHLACLAGPQIGVGAENKYLSNSVYQDLPALPVLRLIGSFNSLSLFKFYLWEFVPSRFPLAITSHWYLFYIHHSVSLRHAPTNSCSSTFIYSFLPKQLHEDLLTINKFGLFLVRSFISLFQFFCSFVFVFSGFCVIWSSFSCL